MIRCKNWKSRYPLVLKEFYKIKKFVNPYVFIDSLSKNLNKKDIIIADDGGHLTWTIQAFKVKYGQKLFSAFGNSPMGYALPASIGASIVKNKFSYGHTTCVSRKFAYSSLFCVKPK